MLKEDRKTQAQACYEVLCKEGFKAFIGTKPHNRHIVSVFTDNKKAIFTTLDRAIHHPRYALSKVASGNIYLLNFKTGR